MTSLQVSHNTIGTEHVSLIRELTYMTGIAVSIRAPRLQVDTGEKHF